MEYIVSKYVITEPVYKVLETTYEKHYNTDNTEENESINFGDFNGLFWSMVSESEYYKDFATYYCHIEPKETIEILDGGKILKFVTTYTLGDDEREEKYEDKEEDENPEIYKPGISNKSDLNMDDENVIERIEQYIISTLNMYDYDKVIPGKYIRFDSYHTTFDEITGEKIYHLVYYTFEGWIKIGSDILVVKDTKKFLSYINPDPTYYHNVGMDIDIPGGINLANKTHIKKIEQYIASERKIPVDKIKLTNVGIASCITLRFYYDVLDNKGNTINSYILDGVNMKEFRKYLKL